MGGFASEVGKTTLMCELLRAFPGLEAIKTTRGHYRSCGRDPHACCVSHLLADEPLIFSGHEKTYVPGKDTGRYWDAGAQNVHWMISTDEQVKKGIDLALERVRSEGVVIEGNSFTEFVNPDYFVMVGRGENPRIKRSAREALSRVSAFYLPDGTDPGDFKLWTKRTGLLSIAADLPIYDSRTLPDLISDLAGLFASFSIGVSLGSEGKFLGNRSSNLASKSPL